MQVSGELIYLTDENGDVIPMKRNCIRWARAISAEGGIWKITVGIDGWSNDYETWVWRPEDGARNFREYLECLVPRKEYIYARAKDWILFFRGRDIVSVNVSGGYVEYSDGRRGHGSHLWLRWMHNVRKKWKKRRGRRDDQKEK